MVVRRVADACVLVTYYDDGIAEMPVDDKGDVARTARDHGFDPTLVEWEDDCFEALPGTYPSTP
jgi:hypothetical protein